MSLERGTMVPHKEDDQGCTWAPSVRVTPGDMSWRSDIGTKLKVPPVAFLMAHGPPGARCPMAVPCEQSCRTRPHVPVPSLCPTCAPGAPGQRLSFRRRTLGQGQKQGQVVPRSCSCSPALAVGATCAWGTGRAAGRVFPSAQLRDPRHHRPCRTHFTPQPFIQEAAGGISPGSRCLR